MFAVRKVWWEHAGIQRNCGLSAPSLFAWHIARALALPVLQGRPDPKASGVKPLKVDDALAYLKQVKQTFAKDPQVRTRQ